MIRKLSRLFLDTALAVIWAAFVGGIWSLGK